MTIIELMTTITAHTDSLSTMAEYASQCKDKGAKDVFMGIAKGLGHSAKDCEAAWKATQPEKIAGGATGWQAEYYDWLAEESRTEQEAFEYLSKQSDNVVRHMSKHLNVWALAETVRSGTKVHRTIGGVSAKKGASSARKEEPKDSWEYNDSDPFADERSAEENFKREIKRAKPRKGRLHPEKVAKFNNPDLTNKYTKAYQAYCG